MAKFIKLIGDRIGGDVFINVGLVEYFYSDGDPEWTLTIIKLVSGSNVPVRNTPEQIMALINADS